MTVQMTNSRFQKAIHQTATRISTNHSDTYPLQSTTHLAKHKLRQLANTVQHTEMY